MAAAARRVVVIEDDPMISKYLTDVCVMFGHEVVGGAQTASDAEQVIIEQRPDYVLMDVRLIGRRDGIDVAMAVYAVAPESKIIYITGSNEPETLERIERDHPHALLIKPVMPAQIGELIV